LRAIPPRELGQGELDRNDPYLILLRRELTRAQARLRRAERERDQAISALVRLRRAGMTPPKARQKKSPRSKGG